MAEVHVNGIDGKTLEERNRIETELRVAQQILELYKRPSKLSGNLNGTQ